MTTEEKAKAYDEALEKAKKFHTPDSNNTNLKAVLGLIFPELAENEDERIKNLLYCIVRDRSDIGKLLEANGCSVDEVLAWLEKQKEQKSIIQDVELNDAVYDYVRDHFIACADFTPEYIKKLMENAFFAGVDYYLLKQESESCEPDTNVEKVIEDVIRVYEKTQGEWVGGYDVDTLIVNLRRAFNKKEQKPSISCGHENGIEWCDNFEENIRTLLHNKLTWHSEDGEISTTVLIDDKTLKDIVSGIWFYVKQEQTESGDSEKPNNHAGWSEEDEKKISELKTFIAQCNGFNKANRQKVFELIDSIRPQPKQEWSEEDEEMIQDIIDLLDPNLAASDFHEIENWLKSLRPQPHWKPSEEQLIYLKEAINKFDFCDAEQAGLLQLYNDLKKI